MRVHLIEPLGRGGLFQHASALAMLLSEHGFEVRLHTASDAEFDVTGHGVEVCGCVEWFRKRPTASRRVLIASRYACVTLPHLVRAVSPADIAHVQGAWNSVLTPLTLALLRLKAHRAVLSPHNTFARYGASFHELSLRLDYSLAQSTIVFSEADREKLRRAGIGALVSPLIQLIPSTSSHKDWREVWGGDSRHVVLFAGQLRPDKGLDRLIDALSRFESPPLLAVVGEDKGALASCRALAEKAGIPVQWSIGFQPLERFVGAIQAADVVVCPYVRASQSGVLSIASTLGVPTVATTVGGLGEAADQAVDADDSVGLAVAIEKAIRGPRTLRDSSDALGRAWRVHKEAYGLSSSVAAR